MSQHCIEANKVKPLPDPAYNSDHGPNNFVLFGGINGKMPKFHDNPSNERKTVVAEILHRIGTQIVVLLFVGQTKRLKWKIENKRED
jgi:hypothetical protein